MPMTIGNISIFMGPQEVGGPDDLQQTIVEFIDGAQKKLDIAVQELDHRPIAEAIISAKQRKVQVRLVLEADYLTVRKARPNPFVRKGTNEENRKIHDAILRSAIKVNSDFNPAIFHQKFIVRDGSAVLTGSTNFTTTGISKNLNHLVIIKDKNVARVYTREYSEIRQGHFGKLNEGHDPAPKDVVVSGVNVKVLFAPDHNPEMEIAKQMAKARERIDFAIFTFAKSSAIDDQMLLLAQTGIKVRGVLDGRQSNQRWAATKNLLGKPNIELRKIPSKAPVGKLHHKLMVIDGKVTIVGSFNYTGPANMLNDENIIVIGSHDESTPAALDSQKKIANYASEEIERIYTQIGVDIPS